MVEKRPPSPGFISNPFIKKRNLEWTLDSPSPSQPPTTADIESGSATVEDHLSHFKAHLSKHISSPSPLSISSYSSLYTENFGSSAGAHFVIHQHDHPIAGTHYDLRLQINETSSASWAIMYGLPGDPQKTASASTGSLLIWDTGTYSILPRQSKHAPTADPSSPTSSPGPSSAPTQQALLHTAFQNRKIRIRLCGSRLPDPYVLNLRLTRSEDVAGRVRSGKTPRKRRRRQAQVETQPETSDEDSEGDTSEDVPSNTDAGTDADDLSAMEREIRELEDEEVRRTNAYPGASNTIGSVHQRRWYLSLDRPACGFVEERIKNRSVWKLEDGTETKNKHSNDGRLSYPFYVRGPDHERSVLTGRLGADILQDEGVDKFVQRQGWKPVLK
ncbi:abc1 containing protein [Fusarium bulbicola]|nr:abc1 containing protein [Fusarium bulbicola]